MSFRLLLLLGLLATLVGCDHATKAWAEVVLPASRVELLPGVLDLSYTQNDDLAFNTLRWIPLEIRLPLILAFHSIASLFIIRLWYLRRRSAAAEHGAYALILAGALGNLIDRIARGYVVDFIHLHHWPVFNFADAFIVAGVALLMLSQLRPLARPPPTAAPD